MTEQNIVVKSIVLVHAFILLTTIRVCVTKRPSTSRKVSEEIPMSDYTNNLREVDIKL